MKPIRKKLSRIALVLIALIIWCVYTYGKDPQSMYTSSGIVSNTKIGWGIKRADNHNQPELRKNKFRANEKI